MFSRSNALIIVSSWHSRSQLAAVISSNSYVGLCLITIDVIIFDISLSLFLDWRVSATWLSLSVGQCFNSLFATCRHSDRGDETRSRSVKFVWQYFLSTFARIGTCADTYCNIACFRVVQFVVANATNVLIDGRKICNPHTSKIFHLKVLKLIYVWF